MGKRERERESERERLGREREREMGSSSHVQMILDLSDPCGLPHSIPTHYEFQSNLV